MPAIGNSWPNIGADVLGIHCNQTSDRQMAKPFSGHFFAYIGGLWCLFQQISKGQIKGSS